MKKEELMNKLSGEARQKLAACKTEEEAKKVLVEAGVEPLDDELLDAVAGGFGGRRRRPRGRKGTLGIIPDAAS